MYATTPTTLPTSPKLTQISAANGEFWGVSVTSAEAATFYLKVWWQGNTNSAPTLGTTLPTLTIPIPTTGFYNMTDIPVIMQGPMFYAATSLALATDTTALGTGGEAITFFVG